MGWNYYLVEKKTEESLKNFFEALKSSHFYQEIENSMLSYQITEETHLHIGKSSIGWFFNLCIYPKLGINELEDWEKLFRDTENFKIIDEDGETVDPDWLLENITDRGRKGTPKEGKWVRRQEEDMKLHPERLYLSTAPVTEDDLQFKNGDFGQYAKIDPDYGLVYSDHPYRENGYRAKGKHGSYTVTTETDFS